MESTNNRTQGPIQRSTSKRSLDVTENRVGTSVRTTLIYKSKQHIYKDYKNMNRSEFDNQRSVTD